MAFFGITVNLILQKLKSKYLFVSVFSGGRFFWGNERKYFAHIPGHSIGSDKQAVEWINSCLGKILELPTLRSTLVQLWLDAASKYTQSLEVEVEYLFWPLMYSKCSNWRCQTLDVYLLFAIWMGQIQSKLIYMFVTYGLASL